MRQWVVHLFRVRAHTDATQKEGHYLGPAGLGNLGVGVGVSLLWSNWPSSTTSHEIRIHIPSTTATSNFPSIKYSAAPQPQSALCLEGRSSSHSVPDSHSSWAHTVSSVPGSGLCYPTSVPLPMLCAPCPQNRTAFAPPPPYPTPTHPSPRPTTSVKFSLAVIFPCHGSQICI